MKTKLNWTELVDENISTYTDISLQKRGEKLAEVIIFQSLENSKIIYERKLILKDLKIDESEEKFRKLFIKFVSMYSWWFQYFIFKMTKLNPKEQGLITQKFTETLIDKIAMFAWGNEWLTEFKNQCDSEVINYKGKVFLDPNNLPNSAIWKFSSDVLLIFGVNNDFFRTMEIVTLTLNSVEFINLPELIKK